MRFFQKIIIYPGLFLLTVLFAPIAEAKDRALLVGIETYKYAAPVVGARNDIAEIRNFLMDNLNFSSDSITILPDREATKSNIETYFTKKLVSETQIGDRVFFYFSGLGSRVADENGDEKDGMDEVLALHDVLFKETSDLNRPVTPLTNYILDDEIGEWLTRLTGRRVVIMLDTSFYGVARERGDSLSSLSRFLRPPVSPKQITPTMGNPVMPPPRSQDSTNFRESFLDSILNGITIISAAKPGREAFSISDARKPTGALTYALTAWDGGESSPLEDLEKNFKLAFKNKDFDPEIDIISKSDVRKQGLFGNWQERLATGLINPLTDIEINFSMDKQGRFKVGESINFSVTAKSSGYLYIIDFSENNTAGLVYPHWNTNIFSWLGEANYVMAGETFKFPSRLEIVAQEPVGKSVIAAFITKQRIKIVEGKAYDWNQIFELTGFSKLQRDIDFYMSSNKGRKIFIAPTILNSWQFAATGLEVVKSSLNEDKKPSSLSETKPIPTPAVKQPTPPNPAQVYRDVVSILIAEKQFAAAERVAILSKREEFKKFREKINARRFDSRSPTFQSQPVPQYVAVKTLESIAESPQIASEKQILQDALNIIGIGLKLDEEKKRQPPNRPLITQLRDKIRIAVADFSKFLEGLKKVQAEGKKMQWLEESESLQDALRQLGEETGQPGRVAAIYTVVADKQLSLIVVTPQVRRGVNISVSKAEVEKLVSDFRQALQRSSLDPRPSGAKLFELIFKPIEADILSLTKGADGKEEPITLMWSLDGMLRYAPISALWDSQQKKYMVERFRNTVFTYRSAPTLHLKPDADWNALGFGVSKSRVQSGINFDALSAVINELNIISEGSPAADSPLHGKIIWDEEFTTRKMTEELLGQWRVVHIASHFYLSSINETNKGKSFLLLGDGELTLAQIEGLDQLFAGVQLLTLSACNTAMGLKGSTGEEIDGFGVIVQNKGAQAVMASLWTIEDEATGELMRKFYTGRANTKGQMFKSEALRKAQLILLNGKYKAGETPAWRYESVVSNAKNNYVDFKKDANAPFAHPYYWSSFILFGNWK